MLLREQRAVLAHAAGFMACVGLGFLLLTLRGEPRTWLAFNGSVLAWSAGLLLLWHGAALHFGAPQRTGMQVALLAVLVVGNLVLGPSLASAPARIVLPHVTSALVVAGLWWNILPSVRHKHGLRFTVVTMVPSIMIMLAYVLLAGRQLADPSQARELHRLDSGNIGALHLFVVAAALFNCIFAALVVERLVGRLRELSERDALTGLCNRRALDALLQQHWQRWQRERAPFALAILDLDHFKRVNDSRGHRAGDAVLTQVAR